MVVDIPNVGTVDFPDTMSKDEIQTAAARQYNIAKQTPLPLNPLEKAIEAGAGKPGGAPLPSYRESVPAEMNPEKQAVLTILAAPFELAGKAVSAVQEEAEQQGAEFLNRTFNANVQPGVSVAPRSSLEDQKGVLPAINRFTSGLLTPGNLLMAPFAGAKPVQGMFAAGAVANVPEAIQQYAAAKTAAEKRDAATSGILDMAMAGLIAKGFAKGKPNASTIRSPETVSGNEVRARMGEEAPLRQQGEAARAQIGGQAQAPEAGQARTVLTDEEMAHIERGGKDVGVPIEVTDRATSENEPFARQISTIDRKTGSILVRPDMFRRWLATVPEKQRELAAKSLMWEERLHLANTDAEATDYASKLSPLEKRITERRYMGPKEKPGQMSDLDLAHEALRYRQQQLMRMTPREVAEAALKERWTLHALDAVDSVIRNTREIFGESADPTVKAMIDRMQQNIGVAKGVIGAEPSAQQKQFKYDELTQPEKVEYSWLHQQAMNARQAHEKLANDTTADTLIDAELALRDFEGKRTPSAEPSASIKRQLPSPDHKWDTNDPASLDKLTINNLYALRDKAGRFWEHAKTNDPDHVGDYIREFQAYDNAIRRKSAEPSARMKKGRGQEPAYKNVEEEPFLLPGMETMTARGVPGAETVEQGERSTVSDYPQAPRTTAAELEQHAATTVSSMAEKGVPKFNDFVETMQHKQEGLKSGQLTELWQKSVFDWLSKAKGEQLSKLMTDMKLYGKEGTEAKARNIPDAPDYSQPSAFTEEGQRTKYRSTSPDNPVGLTQRSPETRRQRAMADIAYELVGPALKETDMTRKEVTPDELRYGAGKDISAAQEFRPEDERNVQQLGNQLVDEARRSNRDPVSATKRLTAAVDRRTGKTFLLSTFDDGRRGPVIFDPAASQHTPLSSMLKRYRIIGSYLLDEPVKDFHQSFDSLKDFNDQFGNDAKRQYQAATSYEPPPVHTPTESIEGTEGLGEGGHLQGPFRAQVEAVAGGGRGAVQESQFTPISDQEATAWVNHVNDELGGEPANPEDMWHVIKDLSEKSSPANAAALSALRKVAKMVQRQFPKLSKDELMDKLAKRLYEDKNLEASVAQSKAPFSPKTIPFPRAEGAATGKELSTIRSKAPTETGVRGGTTEPGEPAISFKPPEKLSPEEQQALVERGATKPGSEKFDYGPWSREMRGVQTEGGTRYWNPSEGKYTPYPDPNYKETMRLYQPDSGPAPDISAASSHEPSATMKRMKEEIQEDYNTLISKMVGIFGGADIRREMAELRDGVDRNSEGRASSAKQSIIEASQEKLANVEGWSPIEKFKARRDQERMGLLRRRAARAVLSAMEIPKETVKHPKGHPPELPPNASPQMQRFVENWVKQHGKPPERIEMAPVVNPANFDKFLEAINAAEHRADEAMKNVKTRRAGRARKEAAIKFREEVQYAKDNWQTDPVLQRTAETMRNELDDHFAWMQASGSQVREKPNYFPNIYKAEYIGPESAQFGENQLLGTQFWQSKRLDNYYQALSKGNFIPASDDPADIVAHHVLNTSKGINKNVWLYSLTGIEGPSGRGPAAMPAKLVPEQWVETKDGRRVLTKFHWDSPAPGYDLVQVGEKTKPVAIHRDFLPAVEALVERSAVKSSWPTVKALLQVQNQIRHGAVLVADTYHPDRALQLAASMGLGKRGGFTGGYSGLIYRDAAELQRAVELGHISEAAAKWASQTIDTGIPAVHTRMNLLKYGVSHGFNARHFTDAIYKDVVRQLKLPGMPIGEAIYKFVGPFNRFVFDRFLPGLMSDGFVNNFEKMRKANPEMDPHLIVRDVLRDMNTRYGALGRQGMFRNRTARDIGSLIFMAPAWEEGLIRSELTTYSRILRSPFKLASYAAQELGAPRAAKVLDRMSGRPGRPQLGALGTGMVKGLAAYFALTQTINYLSRGHSTFQNPEEGHKLDAWLPLPGGHGIWVSPMSVFAEITHDITRIYQARKDPWDTITQIGENKLGPFGRFAAVLASGINPRSHEHITSPIGRFGVAARQLAPVPISFGPLARFAGHAIAPKMVSPNEPGALPRQLLASVGGIKTEVAQSPVQQIQRLASEYARQKGYQSEAAKMQLTDEPSYARLRHAIGIGDEASARKIYQQLLATHKSHDQIIRAMEIWARRPFTGSNRAESEFLDDMNDKEREQYYKAQEQRYQMLQAFEDWLGKQP